MGRPFKGTTVADRLWSRIDRSAGPTGCWLWLGPSDGRGYGQLMRDGKMTKAHRVAWELTCGPIPDGLLVCHHCDNPKCCNPSHLFLGTDKDNALDRQRKGRTARLFGESNGRAKIDTDQAIRIASRASRGECLRRISEEYGLSETAVQYIASGRNWAHLRVGQA